MLCSVKCFLFLPFILLVFFTENSILFLLQVIAFQTEMVWRLFIFFFQNARNMAMNLKVIVVKKRVNLKLFFLLLYGVLGSLI